MDRTEHSMAARSKERFLKNVRELLFLRCVWLECDSFQNTSGFSRGVAGSSYRNSGRNKGSGRPGSLSWLRHLSCVDSGKSLILWSFLVSLCSLRLWIPLALFTSQSPAAAKSLQSCLTLCDPKDISPPGSPIPWILQARTLEWVAISFSNAWKWKVKVKSPSRVHPRVLVRTQIANIGKCLRSIVSGSCRDNSFIHFMYITELSLCCD